MTENASIVHDLIQQRRATRTYADKAIPADVLDRVVASALEAPSAFNLQLRDVVVLTDPELRQALTDSSKQQQFAAAPAVLVFVARAEQWPEDGDAITGDRADIIRGYKQKQTPAQLREAAMIDATLAAGFALIAAQAEGLVSSPTTGWSEAAVKEIIGIGGRDDRGIALIAAIGYPDPSAEIPAHPGRESNRRVDNGYAE